MSEEIDPSTEIQLHRPRAIVRTSSSGIVAAPFSGRAYYNALLLIVDLVEQHGADRARALLRAELRALENTGLSERFWIPFTPEMEFASGAKDPDRQLPTTREILDARQDKG